jgi:hypothetical protein
MLEDTKEITRSRHSKQDRQYNDEMLEDTKGVIRSRQSKQDRRLLIIPLVNSNISSLYCLSRFE